MPRISSFFGIVVTMYFRDHNPPHFHAAYGEHSAKIEIATGEIIEGSLPGRATRLVCEWAILRRRELEANWKERRLAGLSLTSIHCYDHADKDHPSHRS